MPYPWNAHDILTASDLNAAFANLPVKRAWFGKAGGSDQTGISTIADVTGVTTTWTAVSTRLYRVSINICVTKVTTANAVTLYATTAANATVLARSATLAINDLYTFHLDWIETGLSGAQTRKARLETATGTVTAVNSFSRNAIITVEDVGPA